MHRSLREHLVIPSVVITEYFEDCRRKIGKQGVSRQISLLKESGADISQIDEDTAFLAGELLLKDDTRPIGDTLIAVTALTLHASHVISDDPHFLTFGLKTRRIT